MDAKLVAVAFIVLNAGCGVLCESPHYCQTGSDCTLTPGSGTPENIVWKYEDSKGTTMKLLDWDPRNSDLPNNTRWFPRLEHRALLDSKTGVLTILKIKETDNGLYKSEIQVKGALQYSQHDVKVMDPVSKLNVACKLNGTVIEALVCSVDPQVPATFTWNTPDGKMKEGSKIEIPSGQKDDSVYYCTANNEVSEESKEFNLKDCPASEGGNGISAGTIIGIIIGILALIVVICVVIYLKARPGWMRVPFSSAGSNNVQSPNNGTNPEPNHSDACENDKTSNA